MGCDIHAYIETSYVDRPTGGWTQLGEYRFGRNYALFALMAGVRRYSHFPSATTLERELTKRGVEKLDDPRLSEEEVETIVLDARDTGVTCGVPSFEPKGAPTDLGYYTNDAWSLFVVDDTDADEPRYVKRSKALESVAKGYATVWEERDGEVVRITDSDWHTPSWLDTTEVGILAKRAREMLEKCVPEAKQQQEQCLKWARAALKRAQKDGVTEDIKHAEAYLALQEDWATHDPTRSEMLSKVEALHAMMSSLEASGRLKARLVFWFDN